MMVDDCTFLTIGQGRLAYLSDKIAKKQTNEQKTQDGIYNSGDVVSNFL